MSYAGVRDSQQGVQFTRTTDPRKGVTLGLTYLGGDTHRWLYLFVGIILLMVAVERSPKLGGWLLLVVTLSALLFGSRRGAF